MNWVGFANAFTLLAYNVKVVTLHERLAVANNVLVLDGCQNTNLVDGVLSGWLGMQHIGECWCLLCLLAAWWGGPAYRSRDERLRMLTSFTA